MRQPLKRLLVIVVSPLSLGCMQLAGNEPRVSPHRARQSNPLEQARRCRAMSAATEQRDREFVDSPLKQSGFEPLVPLTFNATNTG
jgi:hypothetical protein